MNWDFYSKRSGISLETFLNGTKNLQQGLLLFKQENLSPPPLEELTAHYAKFETDQQVAPAEPVVLAAEPVVAPPFYEESTPEVLQTSETTLSPKKKSTQK